MSILLALMLPAAVPVTRNVTRDPAGNRIVSLSATKGQAWFAAKPGEQSAMHCAPGGSVCIQAAREGTNWRINVYPRVPQSAGATKASYVVSPEDGSEVGVWPYAVIEANGGLLVGHVVTQQTGYSGGGASSSTLALNEVGGTAPHVVLSTAWGGSAMIRACFGERDSRIRGGACQDEYDFSATLTLDPATRTGRPRFRLNTVAKTFPGRLSRDADNSSKRLTKRDMVWWRDPVCSYSRLFVWVPGGNTYAPDRAAPACKGYLEL